MCHSPSWLYCKDIALVVTLKYVSNFTDCNNEIPCFFNPNRKRGTFKIKRQIQGRFVEQGKNRRLICIKRRPGIVEPKVNQF